MSQYFDIKPLLCAPLVNLVPWMRFWSFRKGSQSLYLIPVPGGRLIFNFLWHLAKCPNHLQGHSIFSSGRDPSVLDGKWFFTGEEKQTCWGVRRQHWSWRELQWESSWNYWRELYDCFWAKSITRLYFIFLHLLPPSEPEKRRLVRPRLSSSNPQANALIKYLFHLKLGLLSLFQIWNGSTSC